MATTIASIELQKAIYSSLSTGKWNVYEVVPALTSMPYIEIGNSTKLNSYTKTSKRYQFNIMIHSWSKGVSSAEIKQMNHFVHEAIMNGLSVNEFEVDLIELSMAETLRENDIDTSIFHGIQEFQITISE